MKGSTRNKDQSTEGEGAGKRPKRKCLQWHPLLAKKVPDFSEEEEEEEEDDDLDKVHLLDEDGLEQDVDETEDGESSEQRARRPMNAFLLFCKRHRSLVRQEHPRLDNRGATKILADWWAYLDPKEKQKYTDMAKEYKDAFMKANPGYKWCPTTNKPVKTQSPTVTTRKKLWAFPAEPVNDLPSPKKMSRTEDMPQLNFSMADPTQMGGLSMLLLAGEHALTAHEVSSNTCQSSATDSSELRRKSALLQFAEISSGTSQSDLKPAPAKLCERTELFQFSEISSITLQQVKPCGKSTLLDLAEMCLASEGVKVEDSESVKEEGSKVLKREDPQEGRTEEPTKNKKSSHLGPLDLCGKRDAKDCKEKKHLGHSQHPSSLEGLSILGVNKPEKLKKKKKKNKAERHTSEKLSPKKMCKKRQSSESDIESVIYTIDAVAKGDWGSRHLSESPRKKLRPAASLKGDLSDSTTPKKKAKSKQKMLKEKALESTKEKLPEGICSIVPGEEILNEAAEAIKTEPSTPTEEEALPSILLGPVKTDDCDSHKKVEICGSRKSERSCKGALYKTLVSEGMLTSLRANVDRGKRSSGKGSSSDPEGCWSEDSWVFTQSGIISGSKKLKKSKPKEELLVGYGSLEEEFEKKFNSLPQYSPVTFDRKNASTPRKRKLGAGVSEQQKTNQSSFQSQKKKLFHKIVSKYKHRKEKPNNVPDKAIPLEDKPTVESAQKNANSVASQSIPELAAMQGPLVGSQKRKARKTKITHLVRTADGRVSPARGVVEDKPLHFSSRRTSCDGVTSCTKTENCKSGVVGQAHSVAADMPAVSAFFSLTALAEVAAMENAHRSPRSAPLQREGQQNEMQQPPVLISCADQ
nr:HMG box transcription factor BBX isoform X2 [Geotrypetes seraphini]XP_033796918.1 HMG box transcription factor BBX isoform X2 [Geotrypetes seraphini]XP_033796919.1 HMG box transcription factor BBX isoform X2 [Geotrypetes seraphini]XP_033796920.1 HMG box transcription factor BBX isoform X2 [Geotrypetes seraphini]